MKKCSNGKHSLIHIYSSSRNGITTDVVRWCQYCGAVVIDEDCDGRTNPGALMKMRFPEFMLMFVKE